MAFRYSVVLPVLALIENKLPEKPADVLEMVARAGYDGIDVDAEPDKIEARSLARFIGKARALGLRISGLLGAWGAWHAGEQRDLASTDEAVRAHALGYAAKCIDLSASLGGPVFEICAAPYPSQFPRSSVPLDIVRRNFLRSARQIAEYASERDVPVAIEPINRFEGYPGFLNTVASAMSVADEIDSAHLGVMYDFFHANIEEADISEALGASARRLMHIHLSDSNKRAPGTGHIDFPGVTRTLSHMNYERYLAVHYAPHEPDLETHLRRCIGYMKEMERAVALRERVYR